MTESRRPRLGAFFAILLMLLSGAALAQPAPPPPSGGGGGGPAERRGDDDDSSAARLVRPAPPDVARFGGRPEFLLVGTPAEVAAAEAALVQAGATLLRIRPLPGLDREMRAYVLRRGLDAGTARSLVADAAPGAAFDANALYRYAQSAPRVYAASAIGDTAGCRLPARITIGMIDGPVTTDHPALAAARVETLSALLPGDAAVSADHGTGVAALIAGEAPSAGLGGFARGARLIAVSAFAEDGRAPGADVDRIAGALDALLRNGADVINMSFAGPPNLVLADLVGETAARGPILVAAAGNTGTDDLRHPAALPQVIAVTAVDAGFRRMRDASTGAHIEFAAPGVDLFVADADGARYATGTSFAAPIVSAMAARLVARGARSEAEVRAALRAASRDLGAPGRDAETGWGLPRAPGC
jgi:hypothetical protein